VYDEHAKETFHNFQWLNRAMFIVSLKRIKI